DWDNFNDPYDPLGHRLLAQSGQATGDAHLDRDLGPGTYYVAVSGAGNRYFDPFLADSGLVGDGGDYALLVTAGDLTGTLPAVRTADVRAGPTPDASAGRSPLIVRLGLSGPLDPLVANDLDVRLTSAADPSTNLLAYYTYSPSTGELRLLTDAP